MARRYHHPIQHDVLPPKTLGLSKQFAHYQASSATAVGAGGSPKIINFNNAITSSANVTTGSSWKYTVPAGAAGLYLVNSLVCLTGMPNTLYDATGQLFVNGTCVDISSVIWNSGGGTVNAFPVNSVLNLAVGDYVDVRVFQNSGASRNTDLNTFCWIRIAKIP